MLRIRIFFIPDPNFFHSWSRVKNIPGSGSAPKNLSILSQKLVLSSREYHPGCSSRSRILIFYSSRIPDPVVKGSPARKKHSPPVARLLCPVAGWKVKHRLATAVPYLCFRSVIFVVTQDQDWRIRDPAVKKYVGSGSGSLIFSGICMLVSVLLIMSKKITSKDNIFGSF
jgi:hypothetical protein